jgi:serpin B
MVKVLFRTSLVLCLAAALGGCKSDPALKSQSVRPDSATNDTNPAESGELSGSNFRFGLSLFKTLNKEEEPGKNILISPVSVQTAMHMTVNAAAGSSRRDFLTGLYLDDWSLEKLNKSQQQWRKRLIDEADHPTISSTNSFFKDPERLKANSDFTDRLNAYYQARVMDLDFDQANQARNQINKWVKDQTEDKIEKIIEDIRKEDVGFLINALYYQADWKSPFPQESTYESGFQLASGRTKEVPFMKRDGKHRFYIGDKYMAVDKPFKGEQFSLTVLQPTDDQSVTSFIEDLSARQIDKVYEQLEKGRALVNLPKMNLAYKEDLLDDLKEPMGFDLKQANISNMGEQLIGGRLFISRVSHKSVLEIDEKGAEGAAVTSVGASVTSVPPTLTFDQPFILMLRHVPSNSLLFVGRVMDPQ